MAPTFFKLLNFTLATGKFPYINPVMDLLGGSIYIFVLETTQALIFFDPVIFQMYLGLIY